MGAAKWRNGAPQTAAKENGIRDQVAQHQSPAAHVRFGSKADISRLIRLISSALASFGTRVRFPTSKSLLSAAGRATTATIR